MPEAAASGASQNKPSAVVAVKAEAESAPQGAHNLQPAEQSYFLQSGTAGRRRRATARQGNTSCRSLEHPLSFRIWSGDDGKEHNSCECGDLHSSAPVTRAAPVTGPGTIVVQIAAVSREDDAVALAGALRKKNYNVFVVNNPVTNDKLYHVQVGPFASIQDAEAMKLKLTGEGYNPIVKR